MPKKLLNRIKEFLFGRPLTKHDILHDRLRLCISTGIRPSDVKNFWKGIEELKGKVCLNCGKYLSKRSQKISVILKADYTLCKE